MLIKSIFAVSVVILALASVLFYLYLAPISNVIVIGFDGFRGLNVLGTTGDIEAVLVSGGLILLVNLMLSSGLRKRDDFLAHLPAFTSLFVAILILISVGATIASN